MNMKVGGTLYFCTKAVLTTICALLLTAGLDAQVHIHSIDELNRNSGPLNSHAGLTGRSSLEPDLRTRVTLDEKILGQQMLDYGRIKRLQDGSYILFYQPLKHGYHIYCSRSSDGINWSRGVRIFEGHKFINGDGEEDDHKYATADAVQLANGDILVFCIFHSGKHYGRHLNEFGLCMKRSSDGGRTWSEEQILHHTVDWEPYPMVLDDGEILVFFTDSDHDWKPASVGCSILRSSDNGYTWTLQQQAVRQFRAKARARQLSVGTPRLNPDSIRTAFTNQMPSVIVLNGTRTALGVYESETPEHDLSISLTWEDCKWPTTLTGEMLGPKDRIDHRIRGGAPYIVQMPSGETVLSYGYGFFAMRLGNESGRNLPDVPKFNPFGPKAMRWGALEVKDPHTVFAVATHLYDPKRLGVSHLILEQLRLNHSIEAPVCPIVVDGKNADWEGSTDAFFIGSESRAQCSFRFACDKDHFYVLCECLDEKTTEGDGLTLMFSNGKDKKGAVYALVDVVGNSAKVAKGTHTKAATFLSKNNGYVAELVFDKAALPITEDNCIYFDAVLLDGGLQDSFTNISAYKPEQWLQIKLK